MSERSGPPPAPADIDYPRAALARLAYSQAAREIADAAANEVPTLSDAWAHGAEYVQQAAAILASAETLLTRAVIYARERGASFADIGEALGIARQTAHVRFRRAIDDWGRALDQPEGSNDNGLRYSRLPEGAHDPDQAVARLDLWCTEHVTDATSVVRQHAERDGVTDRMVSTGLPSHTHVIRDAYQGPKNRALRTTADTTAFVV